MLGGGGGEGEGEEEEEEEEEEGEGGGGERGSSPFTGSTHPDGRPHAGLVRVSVCGGVVAREARQS